MFSPVEKSVLSTIIYFDIFDYPLTLMEAWRWPDVRCKMLNIKECLEKLKDEGLVVSRQGFYFLYGRSELVRKRIKRYNIAERKYRRLLWVSKILKMLPFVRMIAVCNNLAYSNARDDSDIDLFIVTKNGRIWCCRFFILLILKLLGLRPRPGYTRDKICASFFVTEDNLNLEQIKIDDNDIYLNYWLKQVMPIYDEDIYYKFREVNSWGGDGWVEIINRRKLRNSEIEKLGKGVIEKLFLDIDEKFYKWLQMKVMPKKLKEMALDSGTEVIINDKMLKFHENDRRGYYRDLFRKKRLEFL